MLETEGVLWSMSPPRNETYPHKGIAEYHRPGQSEGHIGHTQTADMAA